MNQKPDTPATLEDTDTGYIIVNVCTAKGALPIEGALVTVIGENICENGVCATARTNKNGLTPKIPLPAPPPEKPPAPGKIRPYTVYTVEIDKEGYYSQTKISVPVFGGITAIRPVELAPIRL